MHKVVFLVVVAAAASAAANTGPTEDTGKAGFDRWVASTKACKIDSGLDEGHASHNKLNVLNIIRLVKKLGYSKAGDTAQKCKMYYIHYIAQWIVKQNEDTRAEFSCSERIEQGGKLLQFLESVSRGEAQCLVCSFRRIVKSKLGVDDDIFETLLPPAMVVKMKSLQNLTVSEKDAIWETRESDKELNDKKLRVKYGPQMNMDGVGDSCLLPLAVDERACEDSAKSCTLKIPSFEEAAKTSFSGEGERLFIAEGFNVLINMFRKDLGPKSWNFFIERFAAGASADGFYDKAAWDKTTGAFDISAEQAGAASRMKSGRRALAQRDSSFS